MAMDRPVSATATRPATIDSLMIRFLSGWELVRLLMIDRKISGLTMPTNASTMTTTRKTARILR